MKYDYYVIIESETRELYSNYLYNSESIAEFEINMANMDRTTKKLKVIKAELCLLDCV